MSSLLRTKVIAQDSAARFPSLQILLFDVFGTVVDWRTSIVEEGARINRSKRLNVDWTAFADAWRAGYGPSLNRVRTGELPWTKLDVLHRMTLDDLLPKVGISDQFTEAEKVHLNRVWHRLEPWSDSVAGLTRLRRRFVIAPLSNGNLALLTNMGKQAGLPWDCILSTELVQHYKPDPETYLMAPRFFDVDPSAVMMVAAHVGDLQAAQKLGLRTAYVHRPREFGETRQPSMPAAGRFDILARDFLDLASQLGA
jgi:2-haloacid dehalogenase